MSYEYEGSVDFRGDGIKALEYARELLSTRGFKVLPPAANQLWFTNPVSYLSTKKTAADDGFQGEHHRNGVRTDIAGRVGQS